MGYIIALVLIVIGVPVLFLLLSRRTTNAEGLGDDSHDRGKTIAEPSADQPTPGAGAVNQVSPGAERRLPPG